MGSKILKLTPAIFGAPKQAGLVPNKPITTKFKNYVPYNYFHDAGACSWIAVASLFRSSSVFVLIKKVRATTVSISPPSSPYKSQVTCYKLDDIAYIK